MLFTLTSAGISALNASGGIAPQLDVAKLGSGVAYTPSVSDVDLHGTSVFESVPSHPVVINSNTLVYVITVDTSTGPFDFGEVGLYLPGGVLFALASNSELIHKEPNTPLGNGNQVRVDCYVATVGTAYTVYSSVVASDESIIDAYGSVDALPPAATVQSNAFVVPHPTHSNQSLLATSNNGLWSISDYGQPIGTGYLSSVSANVFNVVYTSLHYGSTPLIRYSGQLLVQILTGAAAGTIRILSAAAPTYIAVNHPFFIAPTVGDTFVILASESLPASVMNMLLGLSTGVTSQLLNDLAANPVSSFLKLDGTTIMLGNLNMGSLRVIGMSDPQDDYDAVNRRYLDQKLAEIGVGGTFSPEFETLTVKGDTHLSKFGGVTKIGIIPVSTTATLQVGGNIWAAAPPTGDNSSLVPTTNWVVNYVALAGGGGGGGGTVTNVSITTANGFSGVVANSNTTPSISLSVAVTGLLKGNLAGAIEQAVTGVDYLGPGLYTVSGLTISNGGRLLGRETNGVGAAEEITVGSGLTLYEGILSASGGGGGALSVVDDTTSNVAYYPMLATTTDDTVTTVLTSTPNLQFNCSTGTLYATVFNSLSDAKAKTNITTIKDATQLVKSLRGVSFDWKATGKPSLGFIAQEMEAVMPELVSTDNEGNKSVNYDAAVAVLWQAFRELLLQDKLN